MTNTHGYKTLKCCDILVENHERRKYVYFKKILILVYKKIQRSYPVYLLILKLSKTNLILGVVFKNTIE